MKFLLQRDYRLRGWKGDPFNLVCRTDGRVTRLSPAEFAYLLRCDGQTEIEPGDFVVITAKNVDDPAAITFASEPDIGFTPTFFTDGDYVRALVPIDCAYTEKSVKFNISVTKAHWRLC